MENSMLNIILLISISGMNAVSYASDINTQKYEFNDFDKNVFTNHETVNVELFYPTPFVESVSNKHIMLKPGELQGLLFPAITRITSKKTILDLRHCNSHDGFAKPEYTKEVKEYWEKEKTYSQCLKNMCEKLEGFKELLKDDQLKKNEPSIKFSADDFMLIVQYAAYKIDHFDTQCLVTVSCNGKVIVPLEGEAKELLYTHRSHEQPLAT